MSEVSLGNLYDMNKTINVKQKTLTNIELKTALKKIKQFFVDNSDKYFMLLCRERYDYTLFNFLNKKEITLQQSIKDVKECLLNRGQIISIEPATEMNGYEIWIKIDDEAFAYYLFPYDLGVLEEGVE